MQVTLTAPDYGGFVLTNADGGEYYVQMDYECPRLANDLGMLDATCSCGLTDGTVDCEHRTVDDMIEQASYWLFDRDGDTFEYGLGDEYPFLFVKGS